jgi:hypothetical protein
MSLSDEYLERIALALEEIKDQNSVMLDHLESIKDDLSWGFPGSSLGMVDKRLEELEQTLVSMEGSICMEIGNASISSH